MEQVETNPAGSHAIEIDAEKAWELKITLDPWLFVPMQKLSESLGFSVKEFAAKCIENLVKGYKVIGKSPDELSLRLFEDFLDGPLTDKLVKIFES